MIEASSGQKAALAWAATLKIHHLPGDPVGVMSSRVIRRDQAVLKKNMYYFKIEIESRGCTIDAISMGQRKTKVIAFL